MKQSMLLYCSLFTMTKRWKWVTVRLFYCCGSLDMMVLEHGNAFSLLFVRLLYHFCFQREKKNHVWPPNLTNFYTFMWLIFYLGMVESGWRMPTFMKLDSSRWAKSLANSETLDAGFLTRTKGKFRSWISRFVYICELCSLEG